MLKWMTRQLNPLTDRPLRGPGAAAEWGARRDSRLLGIRAGTLTFLAASPHLQKCGKMLCNHNYFHPVLKRKPGFEKQLPILLIAKKSQLCGSNRSVIVLKLQLNAFCWCHLKNHWSWSTFCVQLRQRPPQQVLFLVVGSCAFSLLLQEILLSPPLRVVLPQRWNLK